LFIFLFSKEVIERKYNSSVIIFVVNKNLLNRNLFLFFLITSISIGAIVVYAKNNIAQPTQKINKALVGNNSQAVQNTNKANEQTIQNSGINNIDNTTMNNDKVQTQNTAPSTTSAPVTQVNELKAREIVVGSGQEVKSGDTVEVNYLGTFLNGQKFDSSYDRNQTFDFTVGAGQVIKGWDAGLIGMKVGGKRELLIPSDLAYGAQGAPGAIPPNTPLRFEIELVAIK